MSFDATMMVLPVAVALVAARSSAVMGFTVLGGLAAALAFGATVSMRSTLALHVSMHRQARRVLLRVAQPGRRSAENGTPVDA